MSVRARLAVGTVVISTGLLAATGSTSAQGTSDGPTVAVESEELRPGDRMVVTIDGFQANFVTVSVCGNAARRGSADCNMPESEGIRLNGTAPTVSRIPVATPPTPCPCLVRVSSRNQQEVALASISLIGHPSGPVVGAPVLDDPLAVAISAEPAAMGAVGRLRASLGGPAVYEVTLRVRNESTETLRHVAVAGSVGRGGDEDVTTFEVPDPGQLGPGQQWEHVVSVELRSPFLRGVTWHAAATAAGQTAVAEQATSHAPVALIVLVLVFVVDVGVLTWRRLVRQRGVRAGGTPSEGVPVAVTPTAVPTR